MPRYRIIPERSLVTIEASSSLHPIHTRTDGLEGFVDVFSADEGVGVPATSSGRLSFPVDRLRSGNPLEDRELRRRIDARRFPTIDGELTNLESIDGDQYLVSGDLTFRGVTQAYQAPMTISALDETTLCLTGEATFDVRDFGMEPPRILMLRVHPEVEVRVEIVAELES